MFLPPVPLVNNDPLVLGVSSKRGLGKYFMQQDWPNSQYGKSFLPAVSPLFSQSVNRRVFENVLLEEFAGSSSSSEVEAKVLYAEEENTIRYMSGYRFIIHLWW